MGNGNKCHRDEWVGLFIYLGFIISMFVLLFAFDYQVDLLEMLLILIFVVPFIIDLMNRLNKPCTAKAE